jgi:arylformamidase
VEPQSISKEEETMAVHLAVLEAEIVVLEGLRLVDVPDGEYFLSAAPLKLGGSDGAPCRVFLLDEKK